MKRKGLVIKKGKTGVPCAKKERKTEIKIKRK